MFLILNTGQESKGSTFGLQLAMIISLLNILRITYAIPGRIAPKDDIMATTFHALLGVLLGALLVVSIYLIETASEANIILDFILK